MVKTWSGEFYYEKKEYQMIKKDQNIYNYLGGRGLTNIL